MRILALTRYGRAGASSRVRTFQYLEPLARLGIDLELSPLFGDDYIAALYARSGKVSAAAGAYIRRLRRFSDTKDFDAIWVEKEMLPWLPALVEQALLPRKIPLILDYDDAVFHRYDMHRSPVVRALLGRKLDRLMARAALVMAGNDYLADRARAAGARQVAVVPTVVDLDRYSLAAPRNSAVPVVGWIGSPTTAPYLESVRPVVDAMVRDGLVEALAIGARPDQLEGSAFRPVPWSEASEVDSLAQCDIGIMPLADTPWERGKCGYKLIQYMALGLPVVASPVGVNRQIVTEKVGFLAAMESEWSSALRRLAGDADLRMTLGAAGRQRVEQDYSLEVWAPRVANLLRGAV